MTYKARSCSIAVFNCGSSSLKYRIIRMPQEEELVSGEAERVGIRSQCMPRITHTVRGKTRILECSLPDHVSAFERIRELFHDDPSCVVDVIAHRYVHPGTVFFRTTRLSPRTLTMLRTTLDLAPLHNPFCYALSERSCEVFRQVPNYVVFDTSFHRTIPRELATYPLPARLLKRLKLRKVGFHGISHQYVMQEACRFLQRPISTQKVISCHLGTGGSSVCAIEQGRSINNSMGFTPLEGLVMNTRSGNLDSGLIFSMMFQEDIGPDMAERILNRQSGLLGLFRTSSDLRDVLSQRDGDPAARLAYELYTRRVKKYIGFYSMLLRKTDILIFTDTMGVSDPQVRAAVLEGLAPLGIILDAERNRGYRDGIAVLSAQGSEAVVLVVPTNEELMMAREAYRRWGYDADR